MRLICWKIVQFFFKFCCFIAVALMISYWFYKFDKDEDLCLVDYKPFKNVKDMAFPETSMCFVDPFVDEKLKEISSDINRTTYTEYLKGEAFDERLKSIDYTNITLNLADYFLKTIVYWKNGSISIFNDTNHYLTFNGFWSGMFLKCFGIDTNNMDMSEVKYISYVYRLNLFLRYFKPSSRNVYALVHYPNQLLLADDVQIISSHQNESKGIHMFLNIASVEILKRRNKRKEPCMKSWRYLDELYLEQHIKGTGCRAPYHGAYTQFPVCSTKKQMKDSLYEVANIRSKMYYPPCQEMSKIDFEVKDDKILMEDVFMFTIMFPEKVKIITQSRAVDGHTLIGNIGGYIGLFLGYALIQVPEMLLAVYAYVRKLLCNNGGSRSNVVNVNPNSQAELITHSHPNNNRTTNEVEDEEGFGHNNGIPTAMSVGEVQFYAVNAINDLTTRIDEHDSKLQEMRSIVDSNTVQIENMVQKLERYGKNKGT